ncbi:hypothetical protein IP69_00045 [Bosea sp. AAP35]|nr:hypothetical protein IP69_00045 [Bosea sp. AAP35]
MIKNTLQCRRIVLVFDAVERVLQHHANVIRLDPLHFPVRIQSLALFFTLAKRDNIVMAWIAMQARDQMLDLGGRPLNPLEEDASSKNQHASDATRAIAAFGSLNDAIDLGAVNAVGGTAAVDEMTKRWQWGIVQLNHTLQTVFVEHEWALQNS